MSPFSWFFCFTNISDSLFFTYAHVFCLSTYSHHSTLEDFQLSHIFLDFLLTLPGWELRLREGMGILCYRNPWCIKFCRAEMGKKGRKAEVWECDQRPPVSVRVICWHKVRGFSAEKCKTMYFAKNYLNYAQVRMHAWIMFYSATTSIRKNKGVNEDIVSMCRAGKK